jgi:hypothetical protein
LQFAHTSWAGARCQISSWDLERPKEIASSSNQTNRGIEMLKRPRPRLTYANVIATLALFLATAIAWG